MKKTIEDIERQAEQELGSVVRNFLQSRYPLAQSTRVSVSLFDRRGRKKRRNASFDNWAPEVDEIRIRVEPDSEEVRLDEAVMPSPFSLSRANTAPVENYESVAMAKLIETLDRAEKRPGYPFISLKWFRDQALPVQGPPWTASEDFRQNILRAAIERRLILTGKVPNPKSPQFPVTSIRLNRLHPEVIKVLGQGDGGGSDFHPIEIKGEPLSATIIRERHR